MQNNEPILSAGYERRDMGARFIIWLCVLVLILLVVVHLVSVWMYNRLQVQQQAESMPPRSVVDVTPIGREPMLELSPTAELEKMRAADDHVLHTYEWIDRSKGILRIPIDDAMRVMADRGLPVRSAASQEGGHEK